MDMMFVETSIFAKHHESYLDDDEFRAFQEFLAERPKAGDVVRATGGLRKVRWKARGKGKRGGVRVIYLLRTALNRIYLVTIYGKDVQDDLGPRERKVLRALVKEIEKESEKENEDG